MKQKNISNGLIVNENPIYRVNKGGTIYYSSGNRLEYTKQNHEGYLFDYYVKDKRIRLNDLVQNGEWVFFPVYSGFKVLLAEQGEFSTNPEVHLNINEAKTPRLKDEISILAALHELGHVNLYNILYNVLIKCKHENITLRNAISQSPLSSLKLNISKEIPEIPIFSESYTKALHESNNFFRDLIENNNQYNGKTKNLERFGERFAWAFALRTTKKFQLLQEYKLEDLKNFYIPLLSSYGPEFVNGNVINN